MVCNSWSHNYYTTLTYSLCSQYVSKGNNTFLFPIMWQLTDVIGNNIPQKSLELGFFFFNTFCLHFWNNIILKLSCLEGLAGLILSNTCIPDIKHWKVQYILKVAMLYFQISNCRITFYASNSNPRPSLWPPALTFLPSNKADNVSLIPANREKSEKTTVKTQNKLYIQ